MYEEGRASLMTGHQQNGDYVEILLAGRIIKMDDFMANNWQAISRKDRQLREKYWFGFVKLRG